LVSAILAIAFATPASATVMGFSDRTSFEAATSGDTLVLEDFESYESDTSFRTTPVDVGAFTVTEFGGVTTASGVNMIDVSPFGFIGSNAIDGDAYLLGWVNTLNNSYDPGTSAFIIFEFDETVSAFAADFNAVSVNVGLLFYVLPAGGSEYVQCTVCTNALGNGFMGFRGDAGESWDAIAILPTVPDGDGSGQRFGMDNLTWVTAASVPEPGTAALLALGLTGIGIVGRRRR